MSLSIFIYPTNSKEIIPKHSFTDIKSYSLSEREDSRILDESDCVVIVNMKTKQYYIYYFIDCDYTIGELRKEINSNIRIFKDQLTWGKMARFDLDI